jgi:hypothetical protein
MGQATRASELRRLYWRWMLELWNGDLAVAAELGTDDFVIHQARADGAGSDERRGPEAVVQLVRDGHAPFGGLTFEIAVGPVAFGGIDLLRARGDRFAEYWVSSDGLALMGQLGAPGPG